jgi:hypothetical protein
MANKQLSNAARKLGAKGGKHRAERMTPEDRERSSRRAVLIHWLRFYGKLLVAARTQLAEFEREFVEPEKKHKR